MSFIHLRVHSEYSIVDSTIGIKDLVARAASLKMPAVALTDYQNIFGAIKFYTACLQAGVKPIIGVETAIENVDQPEKPYSLILLSKNIHGYRLMCALLSKAHSETQSTGPNGALPLKRSWLTPQSCAGIIALSGSINGEIGQSLVLGRMDSARHALEQYKAIF